MNIPESPIRRPQLKRTLHLRAPPAPSLHVTSHARLVSSKLFSNTAFVQNLISYKHSMARASLQEIHQNFQSSHPFRCPAIGLKNTRVNTPALAISTIPQSSQTRCELHSTPPNSNSPSPHIPHSPELVPPLTSSTLPHHRYTSKTRPQKKNRKILLQSIKSRTTYTSKPKKRKKKLSFPTQTSTHAT
jgi:hypothetical protein